MFNKSFNYIVERNISWIHIHDDVYVYKDEKLVDGVVINSKEGLTHILNLNNIKDADPIENMNQYLLCKKEVVDIFQQFPWSEALNIISRDKVTKGKYIIEDNLYEYVKNNGTENLVVIKINCYNDGYNYDVHGNKLPRAYHFDYIEARMSNGFYNLDEILKILKGRDDIRFYKEGIQQIEHYNAERGNDKYIHFVWIPNPEDFDKVKDIKDSYKMYNFIKNEIFKLPPEKNYYGMLDSNIEDEDE